MVNEQDVVRKARAGDTAKITKGNKVDVASLVKGGAGGIDGVLSKTVAKTKSKSTATTSEQIVKNVRGK